ncbi:MAG TPA: hypothetical protein VLO11_04460 [Luteolibacter sp.]|nr:hypothetical protein [Luteolibacter sp.]
MPPDDIAPCSRCGAPTAIRFGDRPLCEDCYTALASCCAGEFESPEEGRTPGDPMRAEDPRSK